VTRQAFDTDLAGNKFIEHAEYSGNCYGTSIDAVQSVTNAEKCCILDIDLQGVRSVKNTDLNARFVFIKPPEPALETLKQRLMGRGTETEASLNKRLETARIELDAAENEVGLYDVVIVNDDVDRAYTELESFILKVSG
jgi:guanylate kinase